MLLLSESEFKTLFKQTPFLRVKYPGFIRNVAIVMGNSGDPKYLDVLEKALQCSHTPLVIEHIQWAIEHLQDQVKAYKHPAKAVYTPWSQLHRE